MGVDDDDLAVLAKVKVKLHRVDAELRGPAKAVEAVFGPKIAGSPVRNDSRHIGCPFARLLAAVD